MSFINNFHHKIFGYSNDWSFSWFAPGIFPYFMIILFSTDSSIERTISWFITCKIMFIRPLKTAIYGAHCTTIIIFIESIWLRVNKEYEYSSWLHKTWLFIFYHICCAWDLYKSIHVCKQLMCCVWKFGITTDFMGFFKYKKLLIRKAETQEIKFYSKQKRKYILMCRSCFYFASQKKKISKFILQMNIVYCIITLHSNLSFLVVPSRFTHIIIETLQEIWIGFLFVWSDFKLILWFWPEKHPFLSIWR